MTQHKSEKEMYSYYLAFMKNYYQVITLLTAQAMCITTIKNLSLTLEFTRIPKAQFWQIVIGEASPKKLSPGQSCARAVQKSSIPNQSQAWA